MWLVCGLGNPSIKYDLTRHNLGFDSINSLEKFYDFQAVKKDKDVELYKGEIEGEICLLCKPLNYMNLSGPPISNVINFFKISQSKVIIIHDDLDLVVGKVKIKIGGGNGGHNGLLSIDNSISKNYKRIRIGIGHPGEKKMVSSYVLKKFSKEDRKQIDKKISLITKNFSLIFNNDSLFLNKLTS